MRHIIFLFVGVVNHFLVLGQSETSIPVVLHNVVGNEPFYGSQTRTSLSDAAGFKGIPPGLQAYRIKELALSPEGNKLFLLYGITKENKRLVLFDADFDKDFRGEKQYLFDAFGPYDRAQEKVVLDTTSAVEIRRRGLPVVYVKPNPFNCCFRYNDSLETKWHLFVLSAHHREGEFLVSGQGLKLALSGNYSPYFKAERTKFFLIPAGASFVKQSESNQPFAFKSTTFVNGREFRFDSLSQFGDTAWLVYKGYQAMAIGNRAGLFARNIKAKTVSDQPFDLEKLRGKYVLLDFWGTWCKPCIALLPKLRKLHQQYSKKGFVLVSLAYDTKKDQGKLLQMIKDQKMNWTNVFDDQQEKQSIAGQYEVQCFPTSILINPEGKIIARSCGEDDFGKLEEALAEVFK